jgi:tRNA dimethylallyltransferase
MGRVIVIAGPTASGKTAMGVALAGLVGGEVVSADSMQIYRYLDIGTAKPTEAEQNGVVHHMIGCVSPFSDYSVSRYVQDASRCVDDILARGRVPLIVGGTGLYIDALLAGTDFAEQVDPALRRELQMQYARLGGQAMRRSWRTSTRAAAKLSPNDAHRIVRAFEIYRATGVPKTQHDRQTRSVPPRYEADRIHLSFRDRADLYRRIDLRVDEMMARGLADEVRRLLDMGVATDGTAMQAIGTRRAGRRSGDRPAICAAVRVRSSAAPGSMRSGSLLVTPEPGPIEKLWEKTPDFARGYNATDYLHIGVQCFVK